MISGLLAFAGNAAGENCYTRGADRTFLQVWSQDDKRTDSQWMALFVSLRELGFSEVIVQWTSYEDLVIFGDHGEGDSMLARMIKGAAAANVKLWIGLDYDPRWWDKIARDGNLTRVYLNDRLEILSDRVGLLVSVIEAADESGTLVVGWYISDEIDDKNWHGRDRTNALSAYLAALQGILNDHRPDWPVLISGFSNGILSPKQWADFWGALLETSGIDGLLFQDGVGAGKLSIEELGLYAPLLAAKLKGAHKSFELIVEIFTEYPDPTGNPLFIAAPFSRVQKQLAAVHQYTMESVTIFSAPDYLLGEGDTIKQLRMDWETDRSGCVGDEYTHRK